MIKEFNHRPLLEDAMQIYLHRMTFWDDADDIHIKQREIDIINKNKACENVIKFFQKENEASDQPEEMRA
jgi:hypothetical protein